MTIDLLPFQTKFLARALAPRIKTAALSIPRGNGKSFLAGHILTKCLTPGDDLFEAGAEYLLGAASLEQARNTFRFIRAELEPRGGYRFLDSATRIGITHKATNTKLRVFSSNAKTAFGIVGVPLVVLDEPGAFETIGGELMHTALRTAQGKPGSPLKVIYIGTLAPARAGWWHDLIERGSKGRTYVMALKGNRDKWDSWREVMRCNPLAKVDKDTLKQLRDEMADARRDSRELARFLSYRLNLPTADESEMLLTVTDWDLATARPVAAAVGRPIVGVDLGGGRSWSAAVAIWESGRIDALACAPGVPSLEDQEQRDRMPPTTYSRLYDAGALDVADGLRVQPPALLWQAIVDAWGTPARVICDRFRLSELLDVIGGACHVEPRVWRFSEASSDIRVLRRIVRDGPLSISGPAADLIEASLAAATVKNDDAGNTRLIKRSTDGAARDDVAAALVLAAGGYDRAIAYAGPRELSYSVV